MRKYKDVYQRLIEIVIIIMVATALGMFSGGATIFTMFNNNKEECDTCDVVDSSNEMLRVYEEIVEKYYGDVDPETLKEIAINAMLSSLGDPNTMFMDSQRGRDFNEKMEGQYKGVGLEIFNGENGVTVLTVFPNTPAEELGLKVDDVIKSVDGNSIEDLSATEVSIIIKYGDSDFVELEVLRGTETFTYNIEKKIVQLKSVSTKFYMSGEKNIGYIGISVFAANTFDQFQAALEHLEQQEIDALIIDVRDNTGGYLYTVTDILELFLEKDDAMYQLKSKDETIITRDQTNKHRTYPIVVITNGVSASASEILAGALRESYGASTVGTLTYGKGTVQETVTLSNGAIAKITTKEWLTPNGNTINGVGIEVDYLEIMTGNYYDETDNQLQKAIEVISEKIE